MSDPTPSWLMLEDHPELKPINRALRFYEGDDDVLCDFIRKYLRELERILSRPDR